MTDHQHVRIEEKLLEHGLLGALGEGAAHSQGNLPDLPREGCDGILHGLFRGGSAQQPHQELVAVLGGRGVERAEQLVGQRPPCAAVHEHQQDGLAKELEAADEGRGVLVLTDMFGGTPSNISLSFMKEHRVEVLTGVNLPMLIKLATLRDEKPLDELATFIKSYGQRNISVASEILPEEER